MKTCRYCNADKEDTSFYKNENKCKQCKSLYYKNLYIAKKDEILKRNRNWELNNKDKVKEKKKRQNSKPDQKLRTKEYVRKNKQKYSDYCKKWRLNNKEKYNNYMKIWNSKNKKILLFRNTLRKLALIQRTPKWLTKQQINEIKLIYKNCPEEMTVDHIIPLRGKTVCGLHVPWNLQYLTRIENSSKNNKLILGEK